MMVALTVVSVITAIVGGVFSSLLRQSHGQLALAQTQADTRLVVRELVIELRETVGPGTNGINPVTKLGWDEIVFHADVAPSDGAPDLIRYFLTCSAGFCDLFRQVTHPDDPTADPLTYTPANASTPEMILEHLLASLTEPLFLGDRLDPWDRRKSNSDVRRLRRHPLRARPDPALVRGAAHHDPRESRDL